MKVAEILGIENVRFVEPEFTAQAERLFNDRLAAAAGGEEGRFLLDEAGEPLALALQGPDGWLAASFLYRNPSVGLIERFEETDGQVLEEDREVFSAAVREYFSDLLLREVPPALEDLNPVRRGILSRLIEERWGRGSGTCVDCGCGSGVGSLVLRDLGYLPLAYDNDASLIARGLSAGRLRPEETICLDARAASRFIRPVRRGIGIMMGEINDFSQDTWEEIVRELFLLSQETLITVGTEGEAKRIRQWGEAMEREVEVTENPADPIYDRWVCTARPR